MIDDLLKGLTYLSGEVNLYPEHIQDNLIEIRIPYDFKIFNKKGYAYFYNYVDKLVKETEDYTISFSYDVNGYEYWKNEGNYLYLYIDSEKLDSLNVEEVCNNASLLFDEMTRRYDYLVDNFNYVRKTEIPQWN